MLPGDNLPVDERGDQSNQTKGGGCLKSPQEILSAGNSVSRGNTIRTDLISTQPLPTPPQAAGPQRPQGEPQNPTCPRCGLTVPDPRLLSAPQGQGGLQGSGLAVHSSSSRRRNRSRVVGSHQATTSDSCVHLLLACLSCQGSVLLLGLLDACSSSCLHALCSSCCRACARCCSAIGEVPVEELNCHAHCHSVMFESCCEPTECLEFCLECCDICHRS